MINYIHFEEIGSTNDYLKENYENLPDFTCVSASFQTKGKGRLGRVWNSNKNENLMFSMLIKDNISPDIPYSLIAGAAVYNAMLKYGMQCQIKWPNDIIYKDRKICGILCESVCKEKIECIVIGIGINVNQHQFSEELKDKAGSMFMALNKETDIKSLLKDISDEIEDIISNKKDFIQICRKNSYLLHKKVYFVKNNKEYEAEVIDIMDNGNLLVNLDGKETELFSGEVTLNKNYVTAK